MADWTVTFVTTDAPPVITTYEVRVKAHGHRVYRQPYAPAGMTIDVTRDRLRPPEGRPGEVRQSLTPGAAGKILARRDAR